MPKYYQNRHINQFCLGLRLALAQPIFGTVIAKIKHIGYFCKQNSLVDLMHTKKQAVSGKLKPDDKVDTMTTNWSG